MDGMIRLAESCPKHSNIYGCPSRPQRIMSSLSNSYCKLSQIPGFISGPDSKEWAQKKGDVFAHKSTEVQATLFSTFDTRAMKGMVYLAPSCPKVPGCPGFPSAPNPQVAYYGSCATRLVPSSPQVSAIPGFPSIQEEKTDQIVISKNVFVENLQKTIEFRVRSSTVILGNSDDNVSLVPSCPRAARNPGFPSVPRYSMNDFISLCPNLSRIPGFPSLQVNLKANWIAGDLLVKCERSEKIAVVEGITNLDEKTSNKMLSLLSCCPNASTIVGCPSAPRTTTEFNNSRLVPCCPRVSLQQGFASLTISPSALWPTRATKPLWDGSHKRAKKIIINAGPTHLETLTAQSMVKMVLSCPKEARVLGFPSAPVLNRPPSILSLYACTPCVSCLPGFPSARMLNTDCLPSTVPPKLNPLFERPYNRKACTIKHETNLEGNKHAVDMAPLCPQLAKAPGFPSILQLSDSDKDAQIGNGSEELSDVPIAQVVASERILAEQDLPLPCAEKTNEDGETSHPVSPAKGLQEFLPGESESLVPCTVKETMEPLEPFKENLQKMKTGLIGSGTSLPTDGYPLDESQVPAKSKEPNTTLTPDGDSYKKAQTFAPENSEEFTKQSCLKEIPIAPLPTLSTEESYDVKNDMAVVRDLVVQTGETEKEKLEMTETKKDTFDMSEPGWEVLEAEETLTEQQAETSPHLFKSIVDVFQKGYDSVATMLGPPSSTLAEDHQHSKTTSSMSLQDRTVPPAQDKSNVMPRVSSERQFMNTDKKVGGAQPTSWDLLEKRSCSVPLSTQDDGFPVWARFKKWPPLTAEDIPNESFEETEKKTEKAEEVKEVFLVIGQDSVCSEEDSEGWLVQQLTEAEQDDVKTVLTCTELDTG
ncbi:uncharacterized protein LOC129409870 [Boleophthalmus pectinirostris]|uniref:uncharacterized protein LOC129409870 n=1 Tax=Boleophthalmus pectinirostris TaxID=150288 RepID=UPI00242A8705|nr:uncharacterized protein LOC129409870 [Boleophthalmus pectinirostris]